MEPSADVRMNICDAAQTLKVPVQNAKKLLRKGYLKGFENGDVWLSDLLTYQNNLILYNKTISLTEAARILKISLMTAHRLVKNGELPSVAFPKGFRASKRVTHEDVAALKARWENGITVQETWRKFKITPKDVERMREDGLLPVKNEPIIRRKGKRMDLDEVRKASLIKKDFSTSDGDRLILPIEASRRLGCSRQNVSQLIKSGRLVTKVRMGRTFVLESSVTKRKLGEPSGITQKPENQSSDQHLSQEPTTKGMSKKDAMQKLGWSKSAFERAVETGLITTMNGSTTKKFSRESIEKCLENRDKHPAMTIKDVAERLGMVYGSVYVWLKHFPTALPMVEVNGRKLILEEDFDRFLKTIEQKGAVTWRAAIDILQCSRQELMGMLRRKRLVVRKEFGLTLIDQESLDNYKNQQQNSAF